MTAAGVCSTRRSKGQCQYEPPLSQALNPPNAQDADKMHFPGKICRILPAASKPRGQSRAQTRKACCIHANKQNRPCDPSAPLPLETHTQPSAIQPSAALSLAPESGIDTLIGTSSADTVSTSTFASAQFSSVQLSLAIGHKRRCRCERVQPMHRLIGMGCGAELANSHLP
ncbi:hypothetical protein J3B02_002173 [Coemansia erecta]|nr:hypothetical protein J3B02_002173 [Coemansia erecta]